MELQMTMDAEGVVALLDAAADGLQPAIATGLATVSEMVVAVMKEKAPVGVGGDKGLRGSIGFILDPKLLTSEIKPTVSYGDAVETGSKPHWAPIAPLIPWAEMHGMNPYALRWSIARKGTQPHPYIEPTFEDVKDEVPAGINEVVTHFLETL